MTSRREVLNAAAASGALMLGTGLLGLSRNQQSNATGDSVRPKYRFPDGFLWGAGISGMQHEGSPLADGAGPSAMYRWAHEGVGKKVTKPDWFTSPIESFDITADFYRRYRSDIQLMRKLNFTALNFEIYWPRIQPEGIGRVNRAGLDFYDRVVDELLKNGIAPLCNLYVCDHPQALHDRGGWINRDMSDWFADYALILFKRLGDRVQYWTTICEPDIWQAFEKVHPVPANWSKTPAADLRATHHLLLGQGLAVQAFRASGAKGKIGNQHYTASISAASSRDADVAAAARADAQTNGLQLDPLFLGEYPRVLIDWYGAKWPGDAIKGRDLSTISTPIDFFGMDYYGDQTAKHDPSTEGGSLQVGIQETNSTTKGISDAMLMVCRRYGNIPIILLEIGQSTDDKLENGKIDDRSRIDYYRALLIGAHKAIAEGVDLRGCFIWSMLDGWEFGWGLSRRFGLVRVDPGTQERTVKNSAYWYRDVIGNNGLRAELAGQWPKPAPEGISAGTDRRYDGSEEETFHIRKAALLSDGSVSRKHSWY